MEILDAYLCFDYIPAPSTFFNNIYKFKPVHSLDVENGLCKIQQYWDMQMLQEKEVRNDEVEILKEFEKIFSDAVMICMRSDVPFGAFLSCGLDPDSVVKFTR